MIFKKQYITVDEKEQILKNHRHLVLIEEQNITEGNFLIFSDEPPLPSIEQQVNEFKRKMEESNLVQLEVLATIFEELMMMGSA